MHLQTVYGKSPSRFRIPILEIRNYWVVHILFLCTTDQYQQYKCLTLNISCPKWKEIKANDTCSEFRWSGFRDDWRWNTNFIQQPNCFIYHQCPKTSLMQASMISKKPSNKEKNVIVHGALSLTCSERKCAETEFNE